MGNRKVSDVAGNCVASLGASPGIYLRFGGCLKRTRLGSGAHRRSL